MQRFLFWSRLCFMRLLDLRAEIVIKPGQMPFADMRGSIARLLEATHQDSFGRHGARHFRAIPVAVEPKPVRVHRARNPDARGVAQRAGCERLLENQPLIGQARHGRHRLARRLQRRRSGIGAVIQAFDIIGELGIEVAHRQILHHRSKLPYTEIVGQNKQKVGSFHPARQTCGAQQQHS